MENFRFENATKILFGHGTHGQVGEYVKNHTDKILLLYGGGSIKKYGTYDVIISSLKGAGIEIHELSGVIPNPEMQLVNAGINICREKGIHFILAVGGGSVIDTAKAIALGVDYEGDVWDFFIQKAVLTSCKCKVGVVLSIPGSGSEASASAVISHTADGVTYKRDYTSKLIRPCFAILNPDLTMTLSHKQTMCGGVDILAHVMERYFTKVDNVELTDRLCEAMMITVINNLRILKDDPQNYHARAEIMWASTIAHNDLLSTGRRSDWASHMIEHELSALYDISHGIGLAIVFPAWMKCVSKKSPKKFIQFAERIWGIKNQDSIVSVQEGIDNLKSFFQELGLPLRLYEVGIYEDNFESIALKATQFGDLGDYKKLSKEHVIEILRLAI